MKRASNFSDEAHKEKASRRQDPVSCQFCRTKKLKCDRIFPCSNCRARKLSCVSALDSSRIAPPTSSPMGPRLTQGQDIDALNQRLTRLEDLLTNSTNLTRNLILRPSTSSTNEPIVNKREETPQDAEDMRLSSTVTWLESDAFEHSKLTANANSLLCGKDVTQQFAESFLFLSSPSLRGGITQQALSLLPSREQAISLMAYYIQKLNWIYRIIHVPTVQNQLNILYNDLEDGHQPPYHILALICTILALSAYFRGLESSNRLTNLAQTALCAANYVTQPTIETIQSIILISQHLLPNMGGVATFRVLFSTAIHSARSLGLDSIDSPANKKRRSLLTRAKIDYVDLEVKRRIWLHLTSTDWMMSLMSGPQCNTYMIHPQQMKVDLPSNVNDIDIGSPGNYDRPSSVITDMTYYMIRYQLAKVCREIVDAINESGCDINDLPYETVLAFDRKLQQIIVDAPVAFRMDANSRAASKEVEERFPSLALQRIAGHFGIQTRFARLHRAYLIRGTHDPRYSYSRMVCLRASRAVIEYGKSLRDAGESHGFQPIRIWTITHHIFVSTAILVMDFCLNKDDPQADERKAEVLDCMKLLEECEQTSLMANQGLKRLRDILRRRCGGKSPQEEFSNQVPRANLSTSSTKPVVSPIQPTQTAFQLQNTTTFPGLEIEDPSSRGDWNNLDFSSLDNIIFDVDFAPSEFEMLFQEGIDAPFTAI